jgi:hypothetical protein
VDLHNARTDAVEHDERPGDTPPGSRSMTDTEQQDAAAWRGLDLVDPDGSKISTVADIHLDEPSGAASTGHDVGVRAVGEDAGVAETTKTNREW